MLSILVMTYAQRLGELIKQALDDLESYRATLVHDVQDLLEIVRIGDFHVIVIEMTRVAQPTELIRNLKQLKTEAKVVVLIEGQAAGKKTIDDVTFINFLEGHFHLPDLLDSLEEVTVPLMDLEDEQKVSTDPTRFPSTIMEKRKPQAFKQAPQWLQDIDRTAQQLSRLSIESSAIAALISRKEQLWAYAGQLSNQAAEELARSVWGNWSRDGGVDFARYVHLEVNNGEYMLYATGLGGDYVLAVAYELEIPFSVIRSQANDLAKRLTHPPQEPVSLETTYDPLSGNYKQPEVNHLTQFTADEDSLSEAGVPEPAKDQEIEPDIPLERLAFFDELLSSIEVPDPNGKVFNHPTPDVPHVEVAYLDDVPKVGEKEINHGEGRLDADDEKMELRTSDKEIPSYLVDVTMDETESEDESDGEELLNEDDTGIPIGKPDDLNDETAPDHLKDTQPTPVHPQGDQEHVGQIRIEDLAVSIPALHNLTYACVLIPRIPHHHLVGEVAHFLNQWFIQLCLAFGYRLEHVAIRPDYLHWVVIVQPETSPAHMVSMLREHTSQRIFTEFPRLVRENPSGDFWAPGYMIVNGRDPLSHRLVEDYIRESRSHQGVFPSPFVE